MEIKEEVLIAMATYNRLEMTKATIEGLAHTTDLEKHRLWIIDNGSTDETPEYLKSLPFLAGLILLEDNIGTAKAINMAWLKRQPGQPCIKMDNDVVINTPGWLERCVKVLEMRPQEIGVVALKRKDLPESPDAEVPWYRTKLLDIGEGIIVEEANHTIGTCWVVNPLLIDRIGALVQPKVYGFDDALYCLRAHLAGLKTVFLREIEIDHIDPGGSAYMTWKLEQAGVDIDTYWRFVQEYQSGQRDIYEPFQEGGDNGQETK
jgi:GT2 family glycosyltransferase